MLGEFLYFRLNYSLDKGQWVGKERLRWAKLFNIPMAEQMPPNFPQNTIQAQRALTAVSLLQPERLCDAIAALYNMSFAERQEIHRFEHVWPVFAKMFGDTAAKEIMDKVSDCPSIGRRNRFIQIQATSDEVKKLLTAKTEEALAEGSFGLPWYMGKYSMLFSLVLI